MKHKGLMEVRDKLIMDIGNSQVNLKQAQESLKEQRKILKEYLELKKQINETYYELMLNDKIHLT